MDYEIRQVDLRELGIRAGVNAVLTESFGDGDLPGRSMVEQVEVVTSTHASQPSLHVAAMRGEEVIGFNAFISHDLILDGTSINCYQSCFTATSNHHRGKKVFQNILCAAHDILRARGAAFVLGFPNHNSHPLFTQKLGYREVSPLKVDVLNIPVRRNAFMRHNARAVQSLEAGAVLQNDPQLIDLKKRKYGNALLTAEIEGSIAWGVKRSTRRKGISIPYLDLGGVALQANEHLIPLMQRLRKEAGLIAYTQAVTTAGSSFNELFQDVQPANTNCLIIFDLNKKTEKDVAFNFFNGVRDVF